MPDDFKRGSDFYLYRGNTALTDANDPSDLTWTELDNARDVTPNFQRDEVDVTTRASARDGWKLSAGMLAEMSFDFEILYQPGDGGFDALEAAFFNRTSIPLMSLDGPEDVAGSKGVYANFSVLNFSNPQPMNGVSVVNVTVKAQSFPDRYTVAT